MKIKPIGRKQVLKSRRKARSYHFWLVAEQPKKMGRLSQLNKHNRFKESEFIRMAIKLEGRYDR